MGIVYLTIEPLKHDLVDQLCINPQLQGVSIYRPLEVEGHPDGSAA